MTEPTPAVTPEQVAATSPDETDWDTGPAAPLNVVENRTPEQLAADGDTVQPYVVSGVTIGQATLLALHAVYVQGGYSTPQIEAERARADFDKTGHWPDYTRMAQELDAARVQGNDSVTAPVLENGDPEQAASLPIDKLRRYVELREQEKQHEAEASGVKDEADKLEAELIDAFTDAGVPNINVGGKTVSLRRDTYAQKAPGVTTPQLIEALRAAGDEEIASVTINSSRLSAYVRELLDDDNPKGLPEPLQPLLSLGERFSVRVTQGARKAPKRRSTTA